MGLAGLARLRALSGIRSLAAAVRPEARITAAPPDGLQVWRSDLDALGGVLRLHGGHDEYARQRTVTRALLADTLHLWEVDAQNGNALSTALDVAEHAELADLRDWLYKDTDWMLPPGRYC